jgi:hypothetical protein
MDGSLKSVSMLPAQNKMCESLKSKTANVDRISRSIATITAHLKIFEKAFDDSLLQCT